MPSRLTVENAHWLLDELDLLVRTSDEKDVNLVDLTTAGRLLSSLEDAPGPEPMIHDVIRQLKAWAEVMFGDARHAGPGPVKTTMVTGIEELRGLISKTVASRS